MSRPSLGSDWNVLLEDVGDGFNLRKAGGLADRKRSGRDALLTVDRRSLPIGGATSLNVENHIEDRRVGSRSLRPQRDLARSRFLA